MRADLRSVTNPQEQGRRGWERLNVLYLAREADCHVLTVPLSQLNTQPMIWYVKDI